MLSSCGKKRTGNRHYTSQYRQWNHSAGTAIIVTSMKYMIRTSLLAGTIPHRVTVSALRAHRHTVFIVFNSVDTLVHILKKYQILRKKILDDTGKLYDRQIPRILLCPRISQGQNFICRQKTGNSNFRHNEKPEKDKTKKSFRIGKKTFGDIPSECFLRSVNQKRIAPLRNRFHFRSDHDGNEFTYRCPVKQHRRDTGRNAGQQNSPAQYFVFRCVIHNRNLP